MKQNPRLSEVNTVCIDLDGVVYFGDAAIDGARDAIAKFREKGLNVRFVTNNSAKSRKSISEKLTKMGIEASPEMVVNSIWACCQYLLKRKIPAVVAIGTKDLSEEITSAGIEIVHTPTPDVPVVLGFNPNFSTADLTLAIQTASLGGELIACNRERNFPGQNGALTPGLGPFVAAVEYGANVRVSHVAGKPDSWMLTAVQESLGIQPRQMLMVGDSIESDIAMANAFGCKSIFVNLAAKATAPSVKCDFEVSALKAVPSLIWS